MPQHRSTDLDFQISNRQEHNLSYQLSQAYAKSDLCQIGNKKYDAKNEARANGASNSHEVGKAIGIYSYASEDKRQSQWHKLGEFAFSNGATHIFNIKDTDVKSFLTTIIDAGYSYNTVKQYCSSLEKMDTMLTQVYPHNRGDWHSAIEACRDIAKSDCVRSDINTRAYTCPNELINSLPEEYKLAGSMQLNHGLRISDACYFKKVDDTHIVCNSKNGQVMTKELTPNEQKLFAKYSANDIYAVNIEKYNYQLQKACAATSQEWSGSHGLRHNYAQNRMSELTDLQGKHRMSYGDALLTTSHEMGHHRMEITEKYLR